MSKVIITNITDPAVDKVYPLPDGGEVPAGTSRTFEQIDDDRLEDALPDIEADRDAGNCELALRPEGTISDHGARVWHESLTIGHGDLSEADTSEVVEDDFTFPADATLLGYRAELDEEFAGGGATACTADVGIDADDSDVLHDGLDVFTGAGIGSKYTSGANAVGHDPIDLSGKKLRAQIDSTNANVADLTAGSITVNVWYSIH